jgi:hypothetical protein
MEVIASASVRNIIGIFAYMKRKWPLPRFAQERPCLAGRALFRLSVEAIISGICSTAYRGSAFIRPISLTLAWDACVSKGATLLSTPPRDIPPRRNFN